MGTFGYGPFDNDSALDVRDTLAEMNEQEKVRFLREVFGQVLRRAPGDTFDYSNQVVGAAAVVAMGLPGGIEAFGDDILDEEEEFADAVPSVADPFLASEALQALRIVTAPGGEWRNTFVCDDGNTIAEDSLAKVVTLLEAGSADQA